MDDLANVVRKGSPPNTFPSAKWRSVKDIKNILITEMETQQIKEMVIDFAAIN